jgi:hypothetical protein
VKTRDGSGSLQHWYRDNGQTGYPWVEGPTFAPGVVSQGIDEAALIQSNLGPARNNFEVVVKTRDGSLQHWYRDNGQTGYPWVEGPTFAPRQVGVNRLGNPALIQSNLFPARNGNFEVVFRNAGGDLTHWYRDNDDPNLQWHYGDTFAQNAQAVSGPALIQSNLVPGGRGNFEVVFTTSGGELQHWTRNNDNPPFQWNRTATFGSGVTGQPALIQSNLGGSANDFQLIAPVTGGLEHWRRFNSYPNQPWLRVRTFGSDTYQPALIQSNLGSIVGNFEVVFTDLIGTRLRHWYCNNNSSSQPWFQTR